MRSRIRPTQVARRRRRRDARGMRRAGAAPRDAVRGRALVSAHARWRALLLRYGVAMSSGRLWGMTPRQSIERECAIRGRDGVIDGCIALLESSTADLDADLLIALAGPGAYRILSGESRADPELWIRVWALRGLLWIWDERAADVLGSALADDSWRVREMAVKVVRRNLVGRYSALVAQLQADPSARVRAAAVGTLAHLAVAGS